MRKVFLFLCITLLISCDKEESKSDKAEIVSIAVDPSDSFTPSTIYYDLTNKQIQIFTNTMLEDNQFPIELVVDVQVSPGASVTPASGTTIRFNTIEDLTNYSVVSENGSNSIDYVLTIRDIQIPNADFENWHEKTGMNSKPFSEPGKYAESSVWATANMGTSTYSAYGTLPHEEGDNTMAKIQTITTGIVPVASGTLFLGKFDIKGAISNPTNPSAATDMGIPFFERPTALKLMYKYQPGEQLILATLKDPGNLFGGFTVEELSGKDEMKLFAILEERDGDKITHIAACEYKSSATVETLTELTIPFTYASEKTPTHFYIVFASSAEGDIYKGAVGSTIIVDDIELVYK